MSYPSSASPVRVICWLLILSLLTVSCSLQAPRSTISVLDPQESKPRQWPVIQDQYDDYELILEPLENVENTLVFGVTLYNPGVEDLYVDPRLWTMYTQSKVDDHIIKDTVQVMDTEAIATVYQSQADRIIRAQKTKRTILIVTSIVLVLGTVAILANSNLDSDEVADYEGEEIIYSQPARRTSVSFYGGMNFGPNRPRQKTPKEQIQWAQEMTERYQQSEMTPTYVPPGEEISFEVYFPRPEGLRAFQLNWQLAQKDLNWAFVHQLR